MSTGLKSGRFPLVQTDDFVYRKGTIWNRVKGRFSMEFAQFEKDDFVWDLTTGNPVGAIHKMNTK